MQVRDELHWLYAGVRGLRTEVVMGGTSIMLERRALSRRPQIVVGTPGRTLDHMRSGALSCGDIVHVALDESDRDRIRAYLDAEVPTARGPDVHPELFEKLKALGYVNSDEVHGE